jgi:hypothetical protein
LVAVCLAGVAVPATASASAKSTAIDFSEHGGGAFNRSFFKGVKFTEGSFVGYIQGDQALVGGLAGKTKKRFSTISANVSPAGQGTAVYTLAAYKDKRLVGSSSVTVTQDVGDPANGPFGYETITLGNLAKKADAFRLDNTFVRSSFPDITVIEFGTSSITIDGY